LRDGGLLRAFQGYSDDEKKHKKWEKRKPGNL